MRNVLCPSEVGEWLEFKESSDAFEWSRASLIIPAADLWYATLTDGKRHPTTNQHNSLINPCDAVDLKNNDTAIDRQLKQTPLTRIITNCEDDFNKLCTMLEFRGFLHVTYEAKDNKISCHTIPIDLRRSNDKASSRPTFPTNQSAVPENKRHRITAQSTDIQPDVTIVLATESVCCGKFIRCFSIPIVLDSDLTGMRGLNDWRLNFTWLRTPESYEFGEEGWSSVGAPVDSLSGIYDMVHVHLTYTPRMEAGFELDPMNEKTFVVVSDAIERFQARVGDYYECESTIDILMTGENVTRSGNTSNSSPWPPIVAPIEPGMRVILSLTDVKSQSFPDVNVPEFTGSGVVCVDDMSQDGTLSVVIGLSICALIILVLLGLAMSRLRDKDRSFKAVPDSD